MTHALFISYLYFVNYYDKCVLMGILVYRCTMCKEYGLFFIYILGILVIYVCL